MRSSKVPALLAALLLAGCFAQLEAQSVTVSRPLCNGAPCVPGGGANLNAALQASGYNTIKVSFGDQPLLKSSTSVGPATVSTSLLLNQAQFDITSAGGNFQQVTSLTLLAAPRMSTGSGDDPCAGATPACPTLAAYSQATDGTANQTLVLKGTGSDLVALIDSTTHELIVEITASGNAPGTALWDADVSMDMALKSRANIP
jgi:hypothetical protein